MGGFFIVQIWSGEADKCTLKNWRDLLSLPFLDLASPLPYIIWKISDDSVTKIQYNYSDVIYYRKGVKKGYKELGTEKILRDPDYGIGGTRSF